MSTAKEKSIPLAIGLNILLPGLGYMYMGKVIVGICALLLILAIYSTAAIITIVPVWFTMNVIMAIDMLILGKKKKKEFEEKTMTSCTKCAETIKKEAKICRYCSTDVEATPV